MRGKDAGGLARVLPSRALARILAYFVACPDSPVYFRRLQRITGLPNRSLQNELARLQALGVASRAKNGRLVEYRVIADTPRWSAIRSLVREFAEPAELLAPALARIRGVSAAFIYGSFARSADVHSASDIDVFVLTEDEPDRALRDELASNALEIAGLLGREVNFTLFTRQQLRARLDSRFVSRVLGGAKRWLIGDAGRLRALSADRTVH